MRAGHQRFDLLGPVGPPCLELQAFGAKESGCMHCTEMLLVRDPCGERRAQ